MTDRLEKRIGKPEPLPPVPRDISPPKLEGKTQGQPAEATTTEEVVPVEAAADVATPADGPTIDISFEQLQKIWPGLFGGLRDVLGARRWAFFREAVPAGVEGNTIILEVAHDFHLASLEQDDAVSAIVATKAADLLGSPVRVRFRSKGHVESATDDDELDMTQLEERTDAETDPTSLLASELGAEVVED